MSAYKFAERLEKSARRTSKPIAIIPFKNPPRFAKKPVTMPPKNTDMYQ